MFPKQSSLTSDRSKFNQYKPFESFQNSDLSYPNKMEFSKTPSTTKNSSCYSFDKQNPQLFYTPKLTNLKRGIISGEDQVVRTKVTDNSLNTIILQSESVVAIVELEFQLSTLKIQNQRLKEDNQAQIQKIRLQKQNEFKKSYQKIKQLNQQIAKQKLRSESLITKTKDLENQHEQLKNRFNNNQISLSDTTKKNQQNTIQLNNFKQESKTLKCQLIEAINKYNLIETDISNLATKLKSSEDRMKDLESKENHWKIIVVTMSEEKILLNNRISQMLQQQAKLENAQVIDKLQHAKIRPEKISSQTNKEMQKEIEYLKNRVNELLSQQQTGSLKAFYEQKISLMEKEIQQLKYRYQSPSEGLKLDDKNDQHLRRMLNDKDRQITDLKNLITNQQNKINQLNKQIELNHSKKQSSYSGSVSEVQVNNMKLEIKNQKRALDMSDQKIKYLVDQSKKKDNFLKLYLSASTRQGAFVEEFFKKYSYDIPSDGFSRMVQKDTKLIQELEDKVRVLSNKLYGSK